MSSIEKIGSAAAAARPNPALKKAAQQFEAVFVRQMMATMRQARLADDVLGSTATDNFRELADARTADSIAALGHFGIAQLIERQLAPGGTK